MENFTIKRGNIVFFSGVNIVVGKKNTLGSIKS